MVRVVPIGVRALLAIAFAADVAVGVEARSGAASRDVEVRERFVERAIAYVELREAAARHVPPLRETPDPVQLEVRQKAVADAIRAARAGARPGDVFGAASATLAAAVRRDFALRPLPDRRAVLEEVANASPPRINEPYPASLALATVPPALLDALPELPSPLEYRLVGRDLVLRDAEANLVVDVVPGVVPGRAARTGETRMPPDRPAP